jgi:hypothetical protein
MKLVLIVVLKMFLKVDQQNKNENYPRCINNNGTTETN